MNTKMTTLRLILTIGLGFFVQTIVAQTEEQRLKIIENYDLNKLADLQQQFNADYQLKKSKALELAAKNNWQTKIIGSNGSIKELQEVLEDGTLIYNTTFNAGGSATIKASSLNTGGALGLNVNGQGMTAGIWDGGAIRTTHQDLTGRVTVSDSSTELSDHATHVCGTVIGSGSGNSNAKGMAYQAQAKSYDWNSDLAEATTFASQGFLVSNHSYGAIAENLSLWYFGAYNSDAADWDNLHYNAPYYLAVFSAGNDREDFGTLNPTKNGGDLLTQEKNGKNPLTVAAVGEVTNYTGAASVVMSSFSNWGPSDDRRIKPDISAKGVGVTSCLATSDTDYASYNGTSMSAPGITGALLLLQQHNFNVKGSYMKSATLKGLVIHTADEAGSLAGPDHKFGWGLMNTERAATVITNSANGSLTTNGAKIFELNLAQGGSLTQTFTSDGVNPLVVTLCWTDPAGTATNNVTDDLTAKLVNDLDIKVVKGATNYFPWAMVTATSVAKMPNSKDNVEKVEVASPSGEYQIQITHKNTLQGGSQNYSLIITGINSTLGTETQNLQSFTMYPNPATNILNISSENTIDTIVIYDALGRKVLQQTLPTDSTNTIVSIETLVTGIYQVEVRSKNTKSTKKLIKK